MYKSKISPVLTLLVNFITALGTFYNALLTTTLVAVMWSTMLMGSLIQFQF